MSGATYKGITSPTLGQWLIFLLCLHQLTDQQGNNAKRARPQQERAKFDLIPMTYTELYPKLVQLGSLVPIDIPPMQPPYPDGTIKMLDVITILVIEGTQRKIALH